ncbi:MAG: S8 family serine peptidase, partial [Gemmatimonadaceae bacterium]
MDDLDQGYIKGGQGGPNRFRGINAAAPSVWGHVDGSPIGFVDFERGWDLSHPEFPVATLPQPLHNFASADETERSHGTSVLSVVLAKDNGSHAVGIAPGANFIGVVSPIRTADAQDDAEKGDVVGALLAASTHMKPGDVLLIEQQLKIVGAVNYPMEAVRPYLDAIRLLVASGVVVIEAGGNGGHNLDNPLPTVLGNVPTFSLNPKSPNNDFVDSGAVLVGSCRFVVDGLDPRGNGNSAGPHHSRESGSPRGVRVNCSAWGEEVEVVRTPTASDPKPVKSDFSGTSAAAAIVAGAALLVQALAVQKRGTPLTPLQLRHVLSDRSLGTPILDGNAVVASMPDLSKIAAQLESLPDIFVGDLAGDSGARDDPLRFDSHDIVVRAAPIDGVAEQIGAGSAVAETAPPSDPLNTSETNFVYLRVRNRGKAPADNAKLHLLWAEAGVMIPPNRWHFVAAADATDVPKRSGSKRTAPVAVAPRITWNASGATPAVPAVPARIALISVAAHDLDPAPLFALPGSASEVPTTFTPDERRAFFNAQLQLLRSNNVGIVNRHVVTSVVTDGGGNRAGDLAFRLYGASGIALPFDLELTTETPNVA